MNIQSKLSVGLLCAASVVALSSVAQAQDAAVETVEVSASRITARGFDAPTPTTVMTAADLQNTGQPAIYDAINELPALQGSVGLSGTPNAGSSNGLNGLSSFSLRGLGAIRTLTLIDGQRVVPANVNGTTDAALFPQMLLQRVDIVTGGASASWGSDAIGGVVNFVTDKNYTGIKGHIEAGASNYGDDYSTLVQLAAGTDFAGGRGHIEAATEYYNTNGIPGSPNIGTKLANGRCCNYHTGTLSYTQTTTPAGFPQTGAQLSNVQNTTNAQYGLITSGPLKGTAFNAAGQPVPFQYGSPCVGNTCLGGEQDGTNGVAGGTGASTLDGTTRGDIYTRVSYNLTSDIQVYGTFNFGSSLDSNNDRTMPKTGVTVQCGNTRVAGGANYYLPAALNAACIANNVTTLPMAIGGDNATAFNDVFHIKRVQRRYVVGGAGAFNLFGTDWTFDTYFQHGENNTSIHFNGMPLVPRLNAAIDAVAGPNGTVVCRSAVAQAEGCLPINIFGGAPISAATQAWVTSQGSPFQISNERQEAFSAVFNSTPFKDWAGDVAVATGVEYREEAYAVFADAYGNGVNALSPLTAGEPADALLNLTGGTNWRTGNFFDGGGNYHVYEGFVEFGVPLINTPALGKADLDLADRATDYSTSGFVDTWKVGLTWDTPVDGIRFRALQSRDVRAPNLGELYAAQQVTSHTCIDRTQPVTNPPITCNDVSGGNPNLKPETAQTNELGIVFSPSYLPGFSLSVDYFRVAVKGEIGKLTDQNQIDLCQQQHNLSYCPTFNLNPPAGTTAYANLIPFNLASATLEGVEYEGSYAFDLNDWNIPGNFVARALAENMGKYIVNSGVPGQPISEAAGSTVNISSNNTTAVVSHWKLDLTQSWTDGPVNIHVAERYFSAGMVNPYAIVCQTPNCPATTAQNPTTAYNHTPDYLFVDVGASYKFAPEWQAYFQINNVGDLMDKPIPGGAFDPIGRLYLVGLRFGL